MKIEVKRSQPEGEPPIETETMTESETSITDVPEPSLEEQLQGQLKTLQEQLTEAQDKYLRSLADLENYKRVAQQQRQQLLRFGIEPLARDLLPVLDHFQLALQSAKEHENMIAFRDGMEIIFKQIAQALEKHSVKPVPSLGQVFDPVHHEAIEMTESDEVAEGTILEEIQPGYRLHDRNLRPSQVKVAVRKKNEEQKEKVE